MPPRNPTSAWSTTTAGGVPQDHAEAVRWYTKAAHQGDTFAQFSLANAYYQGRGVAQDQAKAYFWANLAATLTENAEQHSFVKLRDSISAKLSRSQLTAINKKCRQWMDAFETRKGAK